MHCNNLGTEVGDALTAQSSEGDLKAREDNEDIRSLQMNVRRGPAPGETDLTSI